MPKLKVEHDELIVSEISNSLRVNYYSSALIFILLEAFVFYLGYDFNGIFYFGFFILLIRYGDVFKRPANWHPVKIRISEKEVFVNNKALRKEDLIFLSFHQTDKCRTIRLEAKRNNIFRPNEAIILSDCSGEDEAIQICRIIRDYIDPNLKICFVRLVKGKRKSVQFIYKMSHLSNDIEFEKRYFIE